MKKLSPGVVRAVRNATGTSTAIAREFELAISTVDNIRKRLTYGEVPDQPPAPYVKRRLTDAQVRAIRASTLPITQQARQYGVSPTTIHLIRHRKQIYLDVE